MKGFKVALVVPKITNDLNRNRKAICSYLRKAYKKGAKLILFPECTISGIIDKGVPKHDARISTTKNDENVMAELQFLMNKAKLLRHCLF